MRVILLARISTSRQESFRQLSELTEVCNQKGYTIVKSYSEVISGRYGMNDRIVLQEIIEMAKEGKFEKFMVSEISRIGRNFNVIQFIEILTEFKISIYIHNYGLETLDNNLNQNPLMGMLINFLSSFADLERKLIISRVKSGIEEARRRGVSIGRPKGKTKSIETFIEENKRLFELIQKRLTIREISKLTNRSTTTVTKAFKVFKLYPDRFCSLREIA